MKIIISRKGFDSKYGGCPSPIFEGRRMLSLPIPADDGIPASDIYDQDECVGDIIQDLTKGKIDRSTVVHLDPDLEPNAVKNRMPGWQPAFGQSSSAQSHLRNQDVKCGDLFLFFGWFEHVERTSDQIWKYRKGSGFHSFFGWLQIGKILEIEPDSIAGLEEWIQAHPHALFAEKYRDKPNVLYVANDYLRINGKRTDIRGAGTFRNWTDKARLSDASVSKSLWRLPKWMDWRGTLKSPLTYHGNPSRWSQDDNDFELVKLRSAHIGQEFVLDTQQYPEAIEWALDIIIECSSRKANINETRAGKAELNSKPMRA